MLVRAHGFAIQRGIAEHAVVELDVRPGLPAFSVIGLAGGAARDARERVQAAVLNSGLAVPRRRVTVNLAPASSRRSGSEFDLAIACCVVAADGLIDPARLARVGLFAELGLGGLLRPCAGAVAAAAAAGEARLEKLIVALPDLDRARSAHALPVVGRHDLGEVVALLAARDPEWAETGRTAPGQRAPARHARARDRDAGAPARAADPRELRAAGWGAVDGTLARGAGDTAGGAAATAAAGREVPEAAGGRRPPAETPLARGGGARAADAQPAAGAREGLSGRRPIPSRQRSP